MRFLNGYLLRLSYDAGQFGDIASSKLSATIARAESSLGYCRCFVIITTSVVVFPLITRVTSCPDLLRRTGRNGIVA